MDKAKTIIGCGLENGKNRGKIQRPSGIPERTFERRMADPDSITIAELRRLDQLAKFRDDQLLDLVRKK